MPTIVFSHGQESSPKSTKIQYLAKLAQTLGFATRALDYRSCADAEERVALLREHLEGYGAEDLVLVGSSMGGYVSTVLAGERAVAGLFLVAPALYLPRYVQQDYAPQTNASSVVHGWQDSVIPYQNALRFGQETQANVHLVNDDHRLAQSQALLESLFAHFLRGLQLT
jgi:predicted esterase YcpF (UPF0227 family)